MTETAAALPGPGRPNLEQCEAEPIHIPGAIQPHGVLLALDETDLSILQASTSARALLGIAAEALVGRELGAALDHSLAEGVRAALDRYRARPDVFSVFEWCRPENGAVLDVYVHLSARTVILELEPRSAGQEAFGARLSESLREFDAIRGEMDLAGILDAGTAILRRLTGYDRVMVYRFDEDWHGEVVAEARRADLEPYLGLHYPASDIPAQARQIFAINPYRTIVDVDYVPSVLRPAVSPVIGEPLDLSRSVLRSVSPIHREYLRNMGVSSTLTLSLMRDGRLWGLVACHHETPRLLPGQLREAASWMARDLATRIALAEEVAERRYAGHLKECRDRVVYLMRRGARLPALLKGPELSNVLGAIGADGVALIRGREVITGGAAPESRRVLELAAGISARHRNGPSELFATDCLSEHLPETADLAGSAAGLAIFPLDAAQSIKLMWFRGEQRREVTWGGNPDKAMDVTADGRLSPRQSFAAWREIVKLRGRPWRAEELESARKLGALIDIEWRKMAEEALREHERLLRDVLDSLSAHIGVLDERGRITMVNAAWRRFAEENGGTTACLPGADYLDICRRACTDAAGGEARRVLDGLSQVLSGEVDAFSTRYPCATPAEARWFEMRVFPLRGARSGVVVAHQDITARVRAEKALKRSEERLREAAEEALRLSRESFRLAVENMPDGLVIYDEGMRYRFLNAECLQRTGLPLDAFLGRRDEEVHPAEVCAQFLPRLRETYERRAVVSFECSLTLATGHYDLVVTYVPMLEHATVYQVFGFHHDVTERKQTEAKLAAQAQQLREADWRKDEFLAMLAHELRNPLAPISNAVELLRRGGSAADLDWGLGVIGRQTAHLARLVEDLLDILRISRGVIELRPRRLDLAEVVARAVETSNPALEARGHRLEVVLPREPLQVHGDLVRLTQVVSNLLSNAAKFTSDGGRIRLIAEFNARDIVLRVRDSGCGIEPEHLAQLFDLFFQVDRSTTRSEGGLGIGLSLAKRLVELHGGAIDVRSEGHGRGSEFRVRLPRMPDQVALPVPAVTGQASDASEVAPTAGLRILVVDNNRDAIEGLELLLGSEGHEVLVARDAESAIELVTTTGPDVVLLDIGLAGMDGYGLATTLRERLGRSAPWIIALTGYGQPDGGRGSASAPFDLYLVKPVDFERLLDLLSGYRHPGEAPSAP